MYLMILAGEGGYVRIDNPQNYESESERKFRANRVLDY